MAFPPPHPDALKNDKPLWGLGEVLRLAWPASLSMLNSTVMMFVDGMMVAQVGPEALAAQFTAGILSFVPMALVLGLLTVVNTYVSQNFGARREDRCGQYAWAGLAVAAGLAVLFQALHPLTASAFGLFGHEPKVLELEILYFHYMLLNALPFLAARVLEQFFFGLERSGVVLVSSLLGNLVNLLVNWVLIFGKLGFPAMGLEGAALGTIVGSVTLLVILAGVFFSRRVHRRFATRNARSIRREHCREIFRIGWPAGVQFCNDVFAWGMVTAYLVGRFGTLHIAANTAAVRYISLSFMPAVGISIATTALVGRYIGEGKPHVARRRTHVAVLTAAGYMGLCGLAFLLWGEQLVGFYVRVDTLAGMSPEELADSTRRIIDIGGRLMLLAALFQVFDATAIVFNGALRGAGDTFWPMIATFLLSWTVQIGLGLAMVFGFPELTSVGPWIATSVYIVLLAGLFAWRFESGAWLKIDLLGHRAETEPLPPPGEPDVPLP